MKYLGILVVLALLLVPVGAAAPAKPEQESLSCGTLSLTIHQISPPLPNYYIILAGTGGQLWYMIHGPSSGWQYKGCFIYVDPVYILGPFAGDENHTFAADPAAMSGSWQVIGETATSNAVIVP